MLPNLPPRPVVYLAGPYRSDNDQEQAIRTAAHQHAAAHLAQHGLSVVSPIAQWGPHARTNFPRDLLDTHVFWMEQDLPILCLCNALVLMPLEGWTESRGTGAELAIAAARHIPILVMDKLPSLKGIWWGVGEQRRWPTLKFSPSSFYLENAQ